MSSISKTKGSDMFIVIEGGDAAGKTTLIQGLEQKIQIGLGDLSAQNTVFLKSPTAPFSNVWKDIIKTSSPLTRFYLFRSIAQNDIENAKKIMKDGQNVILERYFLSTEAFNWALDEQNNVTDLAIRSENHINYGGLIKPDLGFFLDVSDETREQRLQQKQKRSDWENYKFQTLFNKKLRMIAKRDNWIIINTDDMNITQVLDFVSSQILQYHR